MDKIIKRITFNIEEQAGFDKRPKIVFKVENTDFDRFYIEPDMLSDGSRYIVMTNENTILIGYYSCVAAFNLYHDYGMDIEPIFFEKMREELGFKRKF